MYFLFDFRDSLKFAISDGLYIVPRNLGLRYVELHYIFRRKF